VLHTAPEVGGIEGVISTLVADLETWKDDPVLQLKYSKSGGGQAHDLKPPPEEYRRFLERLAEEATPATRRPLDFAAAFATEVAVDNNGNTKPMALHFTAGQQQFLQMVDQLSRLVTERDLVEAIVGPWRYERDLPVLQWDCTVFRDYALRAGDPSKEKKPGVPGADWLAFRGLGVFRSAPIRSRVATTGCAGEWKTGTFTWPLWSSRLSRSGITTLLGQVRPDGGQDSGHGWGTDERAARGISILFRSSIKRSDQGGYGSFSPPAVL
jgi:hypothetical protein